MSCAFKSVIAALAIAAAFPPCASAKVGVERISVRVPYTDLDMSSPEGGQTLLRRIEAAARTVCADSAQRSPLLPRSVSTCRREKVEAVVRQLGIHTLTSSWNGTSPATTLANR